jgi:integrase
VSRRAKGTGTIRKRGKKWEAALPGDIRTKLCLTKAEAQKWLDEHQGLTKATTFGKIAEGWLASRKTSCEAETYESYERALRVHLLPKWAKVEVSKITPAQIERWFAGYTSHVDAGRENPKKNDPKTKGKVRTVGKATLQKLRFVMQSVLAVAVRDKAITSNPFDGVRLPKQTAAPKTNKALTDAQVAALRRAALGMDGEPYLRLALGTGARPGELLALRYCDLDFEANEVRIAAAIGRGHAGPRTRKATKTGTSRTVPVPWDVLEPFREHEGEPEDLLFTVSGSPLDVRYVDRFWLQPIAKAAKVAGLTPYVTRHTYATKAARENVNATVLASILGHTSTRMVLEYYTSVSSEDQRKAAEAVAKIAPEKPLLDRVKDSMGWGRLP